MKIIELHMIIKQNHENLESRCEDHRTIMKICKFNMRIKNNNEFVLIQFKNYKKHVNLSFCN